MPQRSSKLYLLCGPTASGKSAKALNWAKERNGEILNADAMQAYVDVPTLTARPDADAMKSVPHYGYGYLAAEASSSVGDWLRAAMPLIDKALGDGPPLCIVGGTGLFFLSLIRGLAEIPPVEASVRDRVTKDYDALGESEFRRILAQHDPKASAKIAANDRQRLIRAAAVLAQTGTSLSVWQASTRPYLMPDCFVLEVLKPERSVLYAACDGRLQMMLEAGALNEVKALMDQGLNPDWPIMRVLGLRDMVAYLEGQMSLEAALSLAQQKTRNYAKRQMTLFNGQLDTSTNPN
jgi:tRNA dimethylallyltransferase